MPTEIELDSASQEFDRPDWLSRDVTDDSRFFNASLVDEPYARWSEQEV